jgi:hypothetical protein
MERSIKPLKEYVETFKNFQSENELNPDDVIAKIESMPENERWSPERIRDDIYAHRDLEIALLNRIPESISVSMFKINCSDIRNTYAQKYRDIIEKETKLIASMAIARNNQLSHEVEEIKREVTKTPVDIDDLDRIKTYIKDCGIKIKKLTDNITECMSIYSILDEFSYTFTNAELNNKWELKGGP